MPNKEHSTSLIASNNFYYNLNKDKAKRVNQVEKLAKVMGNGHSAAQQLLNELNSSEKVNVAGLLPNVFNEMDKHLDKLYEPSTDLKYNFNLHTKDQELRLWLVFNMWQAMKSGVSVHSNLLNISDQGKEAEPHAKQIVDVDNYEVDLDKLKGDVKHEDNTMKD